MIKCDRNFMWRDFKFKGIEKKTDHNDRVDCYPIHTDAQTIQ